MAAVAADEDYEYLFKSAGPPIPPSRTLRRLLEAAAPCRSQCAIFFCDSTAILEFT